MATLDLAGIITRVCTDLKEKFASIDSLAQKQDKLVSGTNIKTLNGSSLLGSGNVYIPVGYELRTNEISMTASDSCGGSRIWFTSADGTKMVPINTSTSSSAATTKTLNTRPIDPFGRIIYYSYAGYANSSLSTSVQWDQCSVPIGFSYVKTLTQKLPVYLKCTPQSDGSAVMVDIVQALPSTNDGYIYIFLGVAYTSGVMELQIHHPVYYHDGTGIRLWTGKASSGGSSWTDVTSIWVGMNPAATEIKAMTDGTFMHISGLGLDGYDLTIPSAYAPANDTVGVGMDSRAGTQDLIVVDSVNMSIASNLQAPNGYVFNVMYLLA